MGTIGDIYDKGRRNRSIERDEIEKTKIHTLRVGNSGCITKEGYFIGANPYKVLARFMGYQTKVADQTRNIFDYGFANEVLWEENIAAAGVPFRSEENYPLVLDVNGYPLTGRPDLVLGREEEGKFIHEQGVELKAICSTGTSKIFKTLEPKTDNLIQAAMYAIGFDIPWHLVYTQGFNYFATKAGKVEFALEFKDNILYFTDPKGKETKTIITKSGIADFWEAIIEAYKGRDHSFFNVVEMGYDGEDTQTWSDYCSFLLAVDSDLPFDEWEEACKLTCNNDWIMQLYRRKGERQGYYLINTVDNKESKVYSTKEECREELWKRSDTSHMLT